MTDPDITLPEETGMTPITKWPPSEIPMGPLEDFQQIRVTHVTLFESENERQKIEPVPIPLPRDFRNFPDVKTRNDFFFIIGLRR